MRLSRSPISPALIEAAIAFRSRAAFSSALPGTCSSLACHDLAHLDEAVPADLLDQAGGLVHPARKAAEGLGNAGRGRELSQQSAQSERPKRSICSCTLPVVVSSKCIGTCFARSLAWCWKALELYAP